MRHLCHLTVLILLLAATLAAPAQAQSSRPQQDRTPVSELHPALQNRIANALRRQGLSPGASTILLLTTGNCPENCNDFVMQGLCGCIIDPRDWHEAGCPEGTEGGPVYNQPERDRGSGGYLCFTLPLQGRLIGTGMPDERIPLR